jgi:two-component system, cell cycle response regulator
MTNTKNFKKLGVSVLYVEDEDDIRNAVIESLQRRVDKLYEAKDGLQGYSLYVKNKPDIVITDIKMPVMNGLEMSQKIRDLNKKVPIIVTTAYEESDFFHKSIEIGINGYVVKPISMQKLMELLAETAKKIELERQVNEQIQCIESLINLRDDIIIMIESKYLNIVNHAFLDFFGFETVKEFNDKYKNILDFLEEKKEYIYKPKDNGNNWIEFLLNHGNKKNILSIKGLLQE